MKKTDDALVIARRISEFLCSYAPQFAACRGSVDKNKIQTFCDEDSGFKRIKHRKFGFYLSLDFSSNPKVGIYLAIPKQCTCSVQMLIFITFEIFLDMCRLKRPRFTPVRMQK